MCKHIYVHYTVCGHTNLTKNSCREFETRARPAKPSFLHRMFSGSKRKIGEIEADEHKTLVHNWTKMTLCDTCQAQVELHRHLVGAENQDPSRPKLFRKGATDVSPPALFYGRRAAEYLEAGGQGRPPFPSGRVAPRKVQKPLPPLPRSSSRSPSPESGTKFCTPSRRGRKLKKMLLPPTSSRSPSPETGANSTLLSRGRSDPWKSDTMYFADEFPPGYCFGSDPPLTKVQLRPSRGRDASGFQDGEQRDAAPEAAQVPPTQPNAPGTYGRQQICPNLRPEDERPQRPREPKVPVLVRGGNNKARTSPSLPSVTPTSHPTSGISTSFVYDQVRPIVEAPSNESRVTDLDTVRHLEGHDQVTRLFSDGVPRGTNHRRQLVEDERVDNCDINAASNALHGHSDFRRSRSKTDAIPQQRNSAVSVDDMLDEAVEDWNCASTQATSRNRGTREFHGNSSERNLSRGRAPANPSTTGPEMLLPLKYRPGLEMADYTETFTRRRR